MCYTGGPRCANHLKPKIADLKKKIDDGDKTFHTRNLYRDAVREYNGTRTGQKEITAKIENINPQEDPREYNKLVRLREISKQSRKNELIERKERLADPEKQEIKKYLDGISKKLERKPFNNGLSSNYAGASYAYIKDSSQPWTSAEKENLEKLSQLTQVLSEKNPDWEKAKRIKGSMNPQGKDMKPVGDDDYKRRDRNLHRLADDLYKQRFAQEIKPLGDPPERERNGRIAGLEHAQHAHVYQRNYDYDGNEFGDNHQKYVNSSLNRIAAGESYKHWTGQEDESVSNLPEHDRVINAINEDNQLYLATAFPDIELKKAMDQQDVSNVSVTPFYNGRENGNAYTVITPDGSTRTFSVYEHRNTDSIIINGKTNWDSSNPKNLPYAGQSKYEYFAEFHPRDKQQAANALAFYMKEAQKGELPSDSELVATAGRRDWNAILSDRVPGFAEWAEKNGMGRKKNETDDDILKNLDF